MAHEELYRAIERIMGIEIERMGGDNLAVLLCSHFDDPDDGSEPCDSGWSRTATDAYEAVKSEIASLFVPVREALATARAEAEALREDAERWRAFYGSERFYVMGAAGFDWDRAAVREPRDETNWLHFTLNVWDRHPAGSDEQGVQGRAMLLSYVDYLRRAALSKDPTQ